MFMMKNMTVIYAQTIRFLCIQPQQETDTDNINQMQKIERHLWEEFREYADEIRHTMEWKEIYPQRKETIERVFADCKENNGLRFTRLKGLKKNQQNAWLIFACHNLKKMALWRGKYRRKHRKFQYILQNIQKRTISFQKFTIYSKRPISL